MQLGLIFSAVGHCKKIYDTVKNVGHVPEDAYILWQLLESLEPIFHFVEKLNSHESTYALVNKALEATYQAVVLCDVLLMRDDPDGRPENCDSWERWWSAIPKAKNNLTRLQLIPKLTSRISNCMLLLNVALSAVAIKDNIKNNIIKGSLLSASERARKVFHLFESGRLGRDTYQLGQASLRHQSKSLGDVGIILNRCDAGYELLFVNADSTKVMQSTQSSPDAGKVEPNTVFDIEGSLKFTEGWHIQRDGDLKYIFSAAKITYALQFSSCAARSQWCYFPPDETYVHVTSEVFELICCFALAISGSGKQVDEVVPLIDEDSKSSDVEVFDSFLAKWIQ